jgi:hypothetical protein
MIRRAARLCALFLLAFLAACATGPGTDDPVDVWSAATTEERLAPYEVLSLDELRVQAQAVQNAGPEFGGTVEGAAYLFYTLGVRLLEEGQAGEAGRKEADGWLIRAASEPLARYLSAPHVAAGTGALIYAPNRSRLFGLPEAQLKLWEIWRDSSSAEDRDAAGGFLLLAVRADYAPAVDAARSGGE